MKISLVKYSLFFKDLWLPYQKASASFLVDYRPQSYKLTTPGFDNDEQPKIKKSNHPEHEGKHSIQLPSPLSQSTLASLKTNTSSIQNRSHRSKFTLIQDFSTRQKKGNLDQGVFRYSKPPRLPNVVKVSREKTKETMRRQIEDYDEENDNAEPYKWQLESEFRSSSAKQDLNSGENRIVKVTKKQNMTSKMLSDSSNSIWNVDKSDNAFKSCDQNIYVASASDIIF